MIDSIYEIFGISFLVTAHAKQLILSASIGYLIGFERAIRGKQASMKTFATLCGGSCLFTILSYEASGGISASPHDVTRIAAQIVTGVGFIGGGVIFKTTDRVEGVTTGALIWLTSAIGMACGFNQISLVIWACLVGAVVHIVSAISHSLMHRSGMSRGKVMEDS
ncbi:MAG: MgtC/SapB family protein [Proteobacteria bacterium]|nr:MgtC/SapB family protein [Pseudomonadota bacterium]